MKKFLLRNAPWILQILAVVVIVTWAQNISASVYTGTGLFGGINELMGSSGISTEQSITGLILTLINFALDLVLLLAVAAIIVAGIYLIVSNGDESSKDKAKSIIFYTVAGIALILLARIIVIFISNIF